MIVGKGMFSDKNKKHTPCVSVDCSTEIKRIEYNKLPFLKPLPGLQVIDVIFCCVRYCENWVENSSNNYKWMYRARETEAVLSFALTSYHLSQALNFVTPWI